MAEAEYKSLCDLTSELLWLSQWCQEAGLASFDLPIPIHKDNQACINMANGNSNVNAKRMKHVDIQLHFVKECIKLDKICLVYTPTVDMLADFLTNYDRHSYATLCPSSEPLTRITATVINHMTGHPPQ
ncbi:hypothetical protein O181_026735 [Austropuccinia psidii MF-1]|uniref:Reverse transcriptase Ty1/copia-type domain-containing protein n=1 Tax=Austropuccinia psidii MF-1 TaxID=1389203 RepID=A0A9Q3CPT8_9BASI|nr:hypothetical protein [Austropuccinia psidii MF-1]